MVVEEPERGDQLGMIVELRHVGTLVARERSEYRIGGLGGGAESVVFVEVGFEPSLGEDRAHSGIVCVAKTVGRNMRRDALPAFVVFESAYGQ